LYHELQALNSTYFILDSSEITYKIRTIGLDWDTKIVINEIEERKMPDKEAIEEYFFNLTTAST